MASPGCELPNDVRWEGADGFDDFWLESVSMNTSREPASIGVWSRLLCGLGFSLKFVLNIGVKSRGINASWESWLGAMSVKTVPGLNSNEIGSRLIEG